MRTILAALVCQYTAGQKFRTKFLVNASSKRGREDGTVCLDFAKGIVQSLQDRRLLTCDINQIVSS